MRIKEIALIGMMSSVLIAVQVALSFLPNIELISLLIILFTLVFGKKTIYIIYVFALLEGLIYGIHLWWINYLYVWTILFVVVRLLKNNHSAFIWSVVSGIYGLSFGAFCSIPYFFMGGPKTALAYWISGIPFDLIHGLINFAVTLILFRPLFYVLKKITKKPEHSLHI